MTGTPFNADDIRKQVSIGRRVGMTRQRVLELITPPAPADRRPGSLTDIEVRRILDEEWPEGTGAGDARL